MTANDPRLPLEEWLRAAYADPEAGCPPPEAFLEAEAGALDAEARRRLDEHADHCPACAAERDLARSFEAGPVAGEVRSEDVAFVVARLEAASPVRPAAPGALGKPGNVVPFPAARPRQAVPPGRSSWLARLAAAAVVLLVTGLFLRDYFPAPSLPDVPEHSVVRGGVLEAVAPMGDVDAAPAELRWVPRQGAAAYLVSLETVDDIVLWEERVAAPPARLPAEVAAGLKPAVTYIWSVQALDAQGARLARSDPERFRVRPAPEK
jgi:hypothetical protein